MHRKITGFVLCVLLVPICVSVEAAPTRVPRIGYLSAALPSTDADRSKGIILALGDLGYKEGENISFEFRYARENINRLPELAAELVRLKVNVIVASGGRAIIRSVMNSTKKIPIVMAGQGSDPVEAGFIKSLARPGGNVTGLTNLLVSLGDKRLELLKDAAPKIAHVAVPYVPGNRTHALELKEVQTAARALKVILHTLPVQHAKDFNRIFAAMNNQPPDGLLLLGGPVMRENEKRIVKFALKNHLPSVFPHIEAVITGGLLFYGADIADGYHRIAYYIDKILKGAKAADLPVEQPTKFEFVVNLKTAKQIGLTVPPNVLVRADRVIR